MHTSVPQVWRHAARPCRFIARRRYPVASRGFHLSQQYLSTPSKDPQTGPTSSDNTIDNFQSSHLDDTLARNDVSPPSCAAQTNKPVSRPYGSAMRRAMRNRQPEQKQKASVDTKIPRWFHERNTVTRGTETDTLVQFQPQVEITKSKSIPSPDDTEQEALAFGGDGGDPAASDEPSGSSESRYAVVEAVWDELRASVKAGLRLPPAQYAMESAAKQSHLVLQYPGSDGIVFLDAVVKQLARELDADLITLNAQDISQLLSEQDLAETGATSAIRTLGYEVHKNIKFNEGEADGEDEVAEIAGAGPGIEAEVSTPRFITIEAGREAGDIPLPNWFGLKSLVASINGPQGQDAGLMRGSGQGTEARWTRLLNAALSSVGHQKQTAYEETGGSSEIDVDKSVLPRETIVHVQDYLEIQGSKEGSRALALLQKVIQDRRAAGSNVVLLGSTSQELRHATFQGGSKILQDVFGDDDFSKTLVITPAMELKTIDKKFAVDQRNRIMDVNIRHLQSMLRYRLGEASCAVKDDIFGDRSWSLDTVTIKQSGIRDHFWSYNQVYWIATLALGSAEPNEPFGFEHIRRGIEVMDRGGRVTTDWLKERSPKAAESALGQNREQLIASLVKKCNSHEKKLLNGVVDTKSLRTTFADVHVPPGTIDALKTLTTLSLVRPEAFTYGVLATDKIPGLLLYGPPGTGKTLLAKAVARESGATVLEVSGSDIYDMYVGEGEKNVKAIFTLAKKLSPCIVFIDEADAIFCSRTGASNRTSHRELINQFLREWDGLNEMSAFIMVATNRPFDLDDAVLRRLPRRLLVDLPTEEDRLAILKIHLKDEQLDPSVDLAEVARRTPLYSGSDLKNLSVAAALACVREENQAAAHHEGNQPYQYPSRRTLTRAHFDLGMEEISASINEDMSSLTAIRKFDEQYGDRKGRRPKNPSWGFISPSPEESTTESARVRS
ncbi:hypothetical protein N7462_003154 [Penicillium macrosclerotiorum]|uniref:uncharacterized protein n=1 Tax=Penicillium macrosclerotiorum TaxID=303699 RepID=UPI002549A71A|nr:uncharacterized protein N7462_003154 [Penicillium macrosclerotiorum]KAJ5688762.1 hypothetical protein N7462_003154 [Penicillium macrosclerotiorum]